VDLGPGVVGIFPSRDATLNADPEGLIANSRGGAIFAGNTNRPEARRALIAFDVASALPAGATITGASLTLTVGRTRAEETTITLHRITAAWEEGATSTFGEGGSGDVAVEGDPTWLLRSFETVRWEQPGGDFDPAPRAAATVGGLGPYTWGSNAELAADVQSWLDDPGANHGWLLMGDETTRQTAKRFASRESADPAAWPMLTVSFTIAG
jgi:hypothetical protein